MKTPSKTLFIISTLVVLMILLVHMESLLAVFRPGNDIWDHIRTHLLLSYTLNTIAVVALSMLFGGILGTGVAYLVSCFEFPFRRLLSILLYLPLAIPPYIMAYVYMNVLGPFGFIHNTFGVRIVMPPLWQAVLVFSLSLFPYVYIGVRGFIHNSMTSHIENARLLKQGEFKIFFGVILPIAKTAILTGMVLVGLEVLGDFPVLHYLGVNTFATAIFRSWMVFRDFDSALRLSGFAIMSVFAMLMLRALIMRFQFPSSTTAKAFQIKRKTLKGTALILPMLAPSLVVLFSLVVPLSRLITWAFMSFKTIRYEDMLEMIFNSIFVTVIATSVILILAFLMATYTRTSSKFVAAIYGKITLISYALPGAVVAMVTLFFFIRIDQFVPFALTTSLVMLIIGYVIRFLGLAYEQMEDGYKKIGAKHHEASRTLGHGYFKTIFLIDLPILKPFILSAIALIFIDVVRELPVTLILRPFNFHTLATQVYQYASDERLPEVGVPSLIIIGISMVFILLLMNRRNSGMR